MSAPRLSRARLEQEPRDPPTRRPLRERDTDRMIRLASDTHALLEQLRQQTKTSGYFGSGPLTFDELLYGLAHQLLYGDRRALARAMGELRAHKVPRVRREQRP